MQYETNNTFCFDKDNTLKITKLEFSVIDSLKKYETVDSKLIQYKISRTGETIDTSSTRVLDEEGNPPYINFCDTVVAFLYIGIVNNVHFGFTLKDSKITFYQKEHDVWIITDSTDFFNNICLKFMDLNGDGIDDLRISTIYDKENGDVLTCVFIFDRVTKTFKYGRGFGLDNVEYDSEKKFIKSWLGGKNGHNGVKWKCIIVGDKVVVDSTVTFSLDSTNTVGILELYKGENRSWYKPALIEKGNPDSIWIKY